LESDETEHHEIEKYHHVLLDIYSIQRKELFKMRKEKLFSDEEIRKAELQLDLNELKITGAGH
jgi:CPA1 family monovalent cation:H+ antiporter